MTAARDTAQPRAADPDNRSRGKEPGRALRRLLRKPEIVAHLESELARLGPGHQVADLDGRPLLGDRSVTGGQARVVTLHGRPIAQVHGPAAERLQDLIGVLALQDEELRALAGESLDRYKEVTMLYSLSEKIIGATDQTGIAHVLCEEVERFLRCGCVAVLTINPETERLETVAACGQPLLDRATRELQDDIVASVVRSGVGEVVNDVPADARSLVATASLRALVCSPLRSRERVFGVVVAGSDEPREFTAGELKAVNSMAAHAAAALEATRLGRDLKSMSGKPVDLIYAVGERPPLTVSLVLAVQHALIAMMSLAYPVLVTLEAGGSRETAASIVGASLLVMALATVLQALRCGPVGAGYLAPGVTSAIFLAPSLLAARVGGLALVLGMTAAAGALMLVISRLMRRFRKLFPPEVSGVVVLMVGLSIVPVALQQTVGVVRQDAGSGAAAWAVGALTLSTIVALTVLPVGRLRLYATAVGMVVGYLAAAASGLFDETTATRVSEMPMFGLPTLQGHGLDFESALLLPFVAAALAGSIKDAGLVISCQKTNDAGWKRPNAASTSGGVVASGLANVAAGALGGVGVGISGGSVGLAAATGATARSIAYAVAGLFAALAFMPKVTTLFAMVPGPVMGAGLLFVACHLVVSGAELITSRMLDARRNYVVGLPLLAGVGMMAVPGVVPQASEWVQAVTSSPLAVSTLLALGLNLVLSAGVSSRAHLELPIDGRLSDAVARFLERQGSAWGARQDVIRRAAPALIEWCEELAIVAAVEQVRIDLQFDEFSLVAGVQPRARGARDADRRTGAPMEALAHVASAVARRYGCSARLGHGRVVTLTFEH